MIRTLALRPLAYLWAAPATAPGLVLAGLAAVTGGRVRICNGVIEAHGGAVGRLLRWRGAAAAALGHVILARDADCLARSRDHEMHHVRQFERWGVFLLPAYFVVAGSLRATGRHPYLDHPFEPPAGPPPGGAVDSA